MKYEWDAAKAKRTYLIKFGVSWLVAIGLSAVPLCLAMKAGAF